MAVTVRDALDSEIFVQADAEVLAGAENLDSEIRWVHSSESPDISRLLAGGELLVTTGLGLGSDARSQCQYVRDLAGVNIAGIVLQLGATVGEVPTATLSEAEALGVPLIVLHRETRFIEITEQLHSTIINRQYQLLKRAEIIARDFTDLVLHGGGRRRIIRRLAELVENPVILEDPAHQIVEFAAYAQTDDRVLSTWETHSRRGHAAAGACTVEVYPDTTPCAWLPITTGDGTWGSVHVLALDTPLDEVDLMAIDRGAAALGLALLTERNAIALAHEARGSLLFDLVSGRYGSMSEALRRSRLTGIELEGSHLAALVAEPRDFTEFAERHELSERDRLGLRNSLLEDVSSAIARAGCVGLSAAEGDQVLTLVGIPSSAGIHAVLETLGAEFCERAKSRMEGLEVIVGVSSDASLHSLRRSFDEAREACRYGLRVGQRTGTYYFGNLGFRGLLLRLSEGPDLGRFVESQLGPLLQHDAESKLALLATLRAYLDCGGNKSVAARTLNIERRSLYYRLRKVTQTLRRDLDDPETRTRLMVAFQGLDVIQGRGSATDQVEGGQEFR
ncbi:MAG: PucR family transcriptional regulator [Chloroflexota bacterium]